MSLPNIDYMMEITKEFLGGKIDGIDYSLDFPYELDKRYRKMHREDDVSGNIKGMDFGHQKGTVFGHLKWMILRSSLNFKIKIMVGK